MQTVMNLINLDYLKLMSDGDADMEQTMLEMLMDELPNEFEKMKELHMSKDWQALTKVSHKMKSTLAFIGNDDMTSANLTIEKLTKQENELNGEDELTIGAMMKRFDDRLSPVMTELKQVASTY